MLLRPSVVLTVFVAFVAALVAAGDAAARSPSVRTVATGLHAPWDMAFLPDGRALITERDRGTVRLLSASGRLARGPVGRVRVRHDDGGENGLLGIAVDPDFARNRFVYLYRTVSLTESQLLRLRFRDGRLRDARVVIAGIPAGRFHNGGRIRFSPDGWLYLTTGETARRPSWAQDPSSLAGKILRTRAYRSGRVVPEVVSSGHRNVQGLDWEPRTGRLLATELGPDRDDELNAIVPGRDYGWPGNTGQGALLAWNPVIAPSGAAFVRSASSAWRGDLIVAALVGRQLRRVSFSATGAVRADRSLLRGRFGRLRSVVAGPDGALYVLTSNTDGRGAPRAGDDRLLRLVTPRR